MTIRHVESMIRMAESFAKMELRQEVRSQDVDMGEIFTRFEWSLEIFTRFEWSLEIFTRFE